MVMFSLLPVNHSSDTDSLLRESLAQNIVPMYKFDFID